VLRSARIVIGGAPLIVTPPGELHPSFECGGSRPGAVNLAACRSVPSL
jgi:hypothetical protein